MCDISYVLRGLYCSLILNSLLPTEKEFRWALVFLRWSSVLLLLLLLLLLMLLSVLLLGVVEQVFSHKVQKFTFNIFASLTIEKFNSKCFKAAVPNLGYVRFSSI